MRRTETKDFTVQDAFALVVFAAAAAFARASTTHQVIPPLKLSDVHAAIEEVSQIEISLASPTEHFSE